MDVRGGCLGLIIVRSATGTEVYRPGPFEKVKDFGPESALAGDKRVNAVTGGIGFVRDLVFQPQARRFLLLTTKGVGVYDYDLNLLRQIEGLPGVERVPPQRRLAVHIAAHGEHSDHSRLHKHC